jgi:hypothetical protein
MTTMIMMIGGRNMFSAPTMNIPPHIARIQRENTNGCSEGKEEEHENMSKEGQ